MGFFDHPADVARTALRMSLLGVKQLKLLAMTHNRELRWNLRSRCLACVQEDSSGYLLSRVFFFLACAPDSWVWPRVFVKHEGLYSRKSGQGCATMTVEGVRVAA